MLLKQECFALVFFPQHRAEIQHGICGPSSAVDKISFLLQNEWVLFPQDSTEPFQKREGPVESKYGQNSPQVFVKPGSSFAFFLRSLGYRYFLVYFLIGGYVAWHCSSFVVFRVFHFPLKQMSMHKYILQGSTPTSSPSAFCPRWVSLCNAPCQHFLLTDLSSQPDFLAGHSPSSSMSINGFLCSIILNTEPFSI